MKSSAENYIWDTFHYCCDPHMDGISQFEKKKALYRLKWLLEDLLPKMPYYQGEDQFVQQKGIEK